MKQKFITQAALFNACKENKYLIVIDSAGVEYGLNCGVIRSRRAGKYRGSPVKTDIIDLRPAGLHEYISLKKLGLA